MKAVIKTSQKSKFVFILDELPCLTILKLFIKIKKVIGKSLNRPLKFHSFIIPSFYRKKNLPPVDNQILWRKRKA